MLVLLSVSRECKLPISPSGYRLFPFNGCRGPGGGGVGRGRGGCGRSRVRGRRRLARRRSRAEAAPATARQLGIRAILYNIYWRSTFYWFSEHLMKKGRYSKFDCIFTFTTNVINWVLSFITIFHIQLLINRSFNNISNAVYFETQNHHFLLFFFRKLFNCNKHTHICDALLFANIDRICIIIYISSFS